MEQVVIVGGGHAGVQAAMSLRSTGYKGAIKLLSAEKDKPYQRPPLSKAYLQALMKKESAASSYIELHSNKAYEGKNIELFLGSGVAKINREQKFITTFDGRSLPYETLILATGAKPRSLPNMPKFGGRVTFYRTPGDAAAVAANAISGSRVAIIGAGFIGLEIATKLNDSGVKVEVLEAADRVMNRGMSSNAADFLFSRHMARGTRIRVNTSVESVLEGTDKVLVSTTTGPLMPFDHVVIGVGVVPDDELAANAGLKCNDGVIVDSFLRTSDPNIFAIGDCARFPCVYAENSLVRLESIQNANDQAKHVAAEISLGDLKTYSKVPWFWTEQGGVQVQMVGLADAANEFTLSGNVSGGAFSVLCFDNQRLSAVESIDRPIDHVIARKLLSQTEYDLFRSDIDTVDFSRNKQKLLMTK